MLCKLNQSWSGGDYLKPTLMAVLAPASVTFSYAAIALFFLATVALGLLIGDRFSVKQLCDKAPLLKAPYK